MSYLAYNSMNQQPVYLLNLEQQSPAPFLINLDNVQLQSLNQGYQPLQPQFIGTVNLMGLGQHQKVEESPLFLKHGLQELKSDRSNDYFRSKGYLALSADKKQDQIWEQIQKTSSESGAFPNVLNLGGIFVEMMESTFSTKGDTLPGEFFNLKTRTKFIHSVAAHGKVKFVSNGKHKYTGIFKGGNHGIVRLSSAAKPVAGGLQDQPLAPGMGLKFLRDGMDSANLVAMFSVEGQKDNWNFFANDFTTQIGGAESAKLKLLSAKFAMATKFIQSIGLSEMAKYDEHGHAEANELFPYNLTFEPHTDVAHLFASELNGKDPMQYVSQLESVPANANLYNVYATAAPNGGKGQKIGVLTLDGGLTKSKWGDDNLFFRHQKYDEDLQIHPEWKKDTPSWQACPFLSNLL